MGNGNKVLIVSLIFAIVVLVGVVSFLLGRMTAPQAPETPTIETAQVLPTAAAFAPAQTVGAVTVPAAFLAEWNETLKTCGTGLSETWMKITVDEIRFHESAGKIKAVTVYAPLDVALTADMSGEGQSWTRTFHFMLSADQTVLTDQSEKSGIMRLRCPAT